MTTARATLRVFRSSVLCLALLAGAVGAAEIDEVRRLHGAGQNAEAIERARKAIAAAPKDAAMRFQLAVMLADTGRAAEARELLEQLAQEHPDLPEPYNNLAALKAAAGDLEGAKASLDQALRANPSLATAHENLGDVQLMLALRSYERAQQLDPSGTSLPAKLALLRHLLRSVPTAAP
ncbi:tetratricopeptide repeat protein [Piscinibacter sp.]|uniref:tetratricopeptide repeat protein n=1 Tax=Piscinibacter sp. TaxID=1903157 RepID=UPI0039E36833